ncbi:MAG: sporulation protein YabP [Clostridiales bacterium]|nr:sporulation protein YabP [Clostridiales bacterium]
MNMHPSPSAGNATANHTLNMINRSKLDITGVSEVLSFDDANITLTTPQGTMAIEGKNLHIVHLNIDRGDLSVEGVVSGIFYFESPSKEKSGFWSKVFR